MIVLGAALWVGAMTLLWLFVPSGESTSISESSSGAVTTTSTRESLLETEGQTVVIVLAVPVVLVSVAVVAQSTSWRRQARIGSGALLLLVALLGAMSVGLPYLPAAVALLVAGCGRRLVSQLFVPTRSADALFGAGSPGRCRNDSTECTPGTPLIVRTTRPMSSVLAT